MSGQIFISYRREESRWSAGRLYDRLNARFYQTRIFMDVAGIALGDDYVEAIEERVGDCDVLIAIIGTRWLISTDEQDGRRLDNPEDVVHMEIATALRRSIWVIPVLIDDALMPRSTDLPDDLKELVRRKALRVSDTSFEGDCRLLVSAIEQALEKADAGRKRREKKDLAEAEEVEKRPEEALTRQRARPERKGTERGEGQEREQVEVQRHRVEERTRQKAVIDVFISYAREDKPCAVLIAQALERKGLSVWWDRNVPPGKSYDRMIGEALDSAKCILVLWSQRSVASDWVKDEAEEGNRRGVLVPALIEEVRVPLGFRRLQTANLVGWMGDDDLPEFQDVVSAVKSHLNKQGKETPEPTPTAESKAEAAFNRGNVFYKKKDYDKAISDFTEAIRLDPNYAQSYNNRGIAYAGNKEYDKAISDFTEAIRLNPNYAESYFNRGNAYDEEYDKAISDYNKAIRLDPRYAKAYNNRGWAYHDKKDYDKAIGDCNEAIRLKPNYADAYYGRGSAYYNKKEYDKAISDLTEAIRLDPSNAWAYDKRGNAYKKQRKLDKAEADFAKADELKKSRE
jgi:tetratricopeptide (TPR) repeat protein